MREVLGKGFGQRSKQGPDLVGLVALGEVFKSCL